MLDWSLKWAEKEPNNASAWGSIGIAYYQLERYLDAVEYYQKSLKINPDNANIWHALGRTYNKLKRYPDAAEAYQKSLKISPDDTEILYNLGLSYFLSGNTKEAMNVIEKLRNLDAEKANILSNYFNSIPKYKTNIETDNNISSAIKIKGFYIGMPFHQACDNLAFLSKIEKNKIEFFYENSDTDRCSVPENGYTRLTGTPYIKADKKYGKVTEIHLQIDNFGKPGSVKKHL